MAGLDDLFRYKDKVEIYNPKTGKLAKTAWVKIIGDDDLKDAFRAARIASAEVRAQLKDKDSALYKDQIGVQLSEGTREDWIQVILTTKENTFANEAPVIVPREDLPEIEEIALQPDAPSLEEQERLDEETEALDDKFRKAVEDYIQTKLNEVKAELEDKTDAEVLEMAIQEYTNMASLQTFMEELNVQIGYRATYEDEKCTKRGFSSAEAFNNAHVAVKNVIMAKYRELDIDNDEIKK